LTAPSIPKLKSNSNYIIGNYLACVARAAGSGGVTGRRRRYLVSICCVTQSASDRYLKTLMPIKRDIQLWRVAGEEAWRISTINESGAGTASSAAE